MKEQLLRKIRSLIRRAIVSLSLPDDGDYPIVQVSYLGKTGNMEVIWPYGMNGQLPADAQTFCFNIEGMEENKAGIGTVPKLRLKVDAEGEVSFGNPLTGSVTYYRTNGDIEIIGKNNKSVTLDGDMDITVSGNKTETILGDNTDTVSGNSSESITGDKDISANNTTITSTVTTDIISPAVNLADLSGKFLMTDDIIAIFNAHQHVNQAGPVNGLPTTTYSAANATTKTKAS